MRKILLGSLVLTIFSISICLFQISCTKDVTAQTTKQLGKVVFTKSTYNSSSSAIQSKEIWTANYDLSNASKVNVLIPNEYSNELLSQVRLSPDGTKIFFTAFKWPASGDARGDLFSCNIDGSNLIKLTNSTSTVDYILEGVY